MQKEIVYHEIITMNYAPECIEGIEYENCEFKITHTDFENCRFVKCEFKSFMHRCNFQNCTFRECTFEEIDQCTFTECNIDYSLIKDINQSNINKCKFHESRVTGGVINCVLIEDCDFYRLKIQRSEIDSTLKRCKLVKTDIQFSDISITYEDISYDKISDEYSRMNFKKYIEVKLI